MHSVGRTTLALFLSGGIALTVCGCGSKAGFRVAPAQGVVLLDGKPVEGVSVVLRQPGLPMVASGNTDAKGHFMLSTYGNFDGAPVGECIATVTEIENDLTTVEAEVPFVDNSSIADPDERARANEAAKNERMNKLAVLAAERRRKKPPAVIPKKYSDPQTSGLKFEIRASGENLIQIALTN